MLILNLQTQQIYLNYGFYIPIFISYNDNYTNSNGQQTGNGNAETQTYSAVSSYLGNMSVNYQTCSENGTAIVSPSVIIHSALVTNPDQIFTIMLPNKENTYQAPDENGVYVMQTATSYLTGFNTTPILLVEGADTIPRSINQNEYQIILTGIPSPSEENAYGFYSTIAK